jgi:hypothetical protein
MHSRRFACLLLGIWLAGGLLMTWMVNENARAVDRLLVHADPAATLRIKVLGPAETALLMRYEAAELTRNEMELWEITQLILGTLFFFFLLFGTGEGKFSLALSLAMLLCVVAQRFVITPEIVSFGKITDFVAPAAASGDRAKMLVMQGAYFAVEIGKWILILVLAAILIGSGRGRGRGRDRSANIWNKFNVVDKADHGHVDR